MEISRVPSDLERKEYKQLGEKTGNQVFLKELSIVGMTFVKQHKPFDAQCAKLDFKDKIDALERESQRINGFVKESDIEQLRIGDLRKYGEESRFELVEDDEEVEMQNINNTKTAVVTGHNMKYKCTERNHGCTVVVPLELWQEKFGKKTKIVEKE